MLVAGQEGTKASSWKTRIDNGHGDACIAMLLVVNQACSYLYKSRNVDSASLRRGATNSSAVFATSRGISTNTTSLAPSGLEVHAACPHFEAKGAADLSGGSSKCREGVRMSVVGLR